MKKVIRKGNVRLRERKLSNGNLSLYLDIYRDGKRVYEFLKLYVNPKARTPVEKEQNQRVRIIAEELRAKREVEIYSSALGVKSLSKSKVDFIEYFQRYIDKYTKRDIAVMRSTLNRFKDFLFKEYGDKYSKGIKANMIDKELVSLFVDYLQSISQGEGARTSYSRFKKVIKNAVENGIIIKDPCSGISCKVDDQILRKDILNIDEMNRLINTNDPDINQEVRRAFIFCLYCGLRFCDVSTLRYSNIDYSNKSLKFEQAKTKGHSSNSGVVIPLNDGLISLIGNPTSDLNDELIFKLPYYESCIRNLRKWVEAAGINKHITWHCARHSFAVNILNNGANIKTVSSLLGHSGLKHTEKYTRAIDPLKEAAINSLPELKVQ